MQRTYKYRLYPNKERLERLTGFRGPDGGPIAAHHGSFPQGLLPWREIYPTTYRRQAL